MQWRAAPGIIAGRGALDASGGAGPDTPLTIFGSSNVLAWYDFQDAATVHKDGSDNITSVDDKSGNGFTLTPVGTAPVWSATALGGGTKPGITFSAGGLASGTTVPLGGTVYSGFAVAKQTANSSYNRLLILKGVSSSDTAGTSVILLLNNGFSGGIEAYKNGDLSAVACSVGAQIRYGSVLDGANHTVYADNVGATPVAYSGALDATGSIVIGSNPSGGEVWGQAGGEFIVLSIAPSSGQLAALDTYFTGRW